MSSRLRRTSARDEGFTLIEQLIAMTILMIVVGSMLTFFTVAQKNSVRHAGRGRALGELRVVMERLTKEVRQAEAIRAGSGAAILDMDTYVDAVPRRIRYEASGDALTRAVDGASPVTILERLDSTSLFTYSPTVADPTDVEVHIVVRPEHFASDGATVALTSEVELRNRG